MSIPRELRIRKQWTTYQPLTKAPHARVNDPSTWVTYSEASSNSSRLGFIFSKDDPYVGIDLDDCFEHDDGMVRLKPWAAAVVSMVPPDAYIEQSPSGNGLHIIVCGPPLDQGRKAGGIEVYSHSRYFTMTGRPWLHYAPETIGCINQDTLDKIVPDRKVKQVPVTTNHDRPENALDRARAYVEKYPPAISGQNGHHHTYRLAAKLVGDFLLTEDESIGVLGEWNQTCSPPWTDYEIRHKVRSATQRADRTGAAYVDDADAIEEAGILANALRHADMIPEHLLDVPGWIGSFMDWCLSQNHRKNRTLALLGGIAWAAHLTGRRIQDDSGVRTNLYLIGIAPSSGGKQAPLECVKLLVESGHRPDSVIGKVTSDTAIAQQLLREPSSVCLWDEFGLFLQRTGAKGPMQSIQDSLLELWGATRTTWKAKTFAASERDISVPQPCFSVLGMTTPDHFWAGVTRMHLRDGFAGRLMVVDTGPRADRGTVSISDPPEELVRIEQEWTIGGRTGNLADFGFGRARVPIAKVSSEANAIFEDLLDRIDSETDDDRASIWGRAIEKARKLALIYACSRSPAVRVDREAAQWGHDFAVWATESFLTRVSTKVFGAEGQHSDVAREVLAEIGKTGSSSLKELLSATGASAKMLRDVLGTLLEAERIGQTKRGREVVYVMR